MTHMQLGGGIDNAMRALGYQVTGPSDPEDCAAFEVHCPDGVTVLLAKDEFEGWQKADEHWRDSALAKMQIERFSPNNPDLAALSEAATQGLMEDQGLSLFAGNAEVCLMGEPAQWSGGRPDMCNNADNNAEFITALWNEYRAGRLVQIDEGMREMVADLDMACELIQEAKGADGPKGGFVTDHLDAAENWIDKVRAALAAMMGGAK